MKNKFHNFTMEWILPILIWTMLLYVAWDVLRFCKSNIPPKWKKDLQEMIR